MKERTKKLLACAGTVGVMTIMTTIPARFQDISVRTCWCQGKRHSSFLNLYTETANW